MTNKKQPSSKERDALPDNVLMHTLQSGDVDKLGVLFERYKNPLFGYFYLRIKDKQASEDLVQNVFYRILKYRNRFRGEGKFSSWMYRIARNVCTDYVKKNRRYTFEEVPAHQQNDDSTPEEDLLKSEQSDLINQALNLLKEDHKEVIILSRYQGMKYHEIGKVMGCSENTVKIRVFRAMKQLKTIYTGLESEIL